MSLTWFVGLMRSIEAQGGNPLDFWVTDDPGVPGSVQLHIDPDNMHADAPMRLHAFLQLVRLNADDVPDFDLDSRALLCASLVASRAVQATQEPGASLESMADFFGKLESDLYVESHAALKSEGRM